MMKDRFGGLFSPLSRRDINTIRNVERYFFSQDSFLGEVPLHDEYGVPLSQMPLDEIIEGVELYIEYLREERGTGSFAYSGDDPEMSAMAEMAEWTQEMSQEQRVMWAEMQRKARYWQAQLQPILEKLKRAQNKLQNEALE